MKVTKVQIVRQADEPNAEAGATCRKRAIGEATLYRWKRRFGGVTASQLSRLRQFGQESARMHKLIADRDLEIDPAKELLQKNLRTTDRRQAYQYRQRRNI